MIKKHLGLAAALAIAVSMLSGSAVVEKGTDVFEFEGIFYFDCLGEEIFTVLSAPYKSHMVTKPNGKTTYVEIWDTKAYFGEIIGLETDREWDRTKTVTTMVSHSDGSWGYAFKSVFVERKTGDRTIVHESVRVSFNAAGELKVDRYDFDCKPIGKKN